MEQPRHWSVRLEGNAWDLEELSEHMRGDVRIAREADDWALSAGVFETMDAGVQVSEAAEDIVDALRAIQVIKIGSSADLRVGAVIEHHPDGSRTPHVFARGEIIVSARVRARGVAVVDGATQERPLPAPWEPIMELAQLNERVAMAMAYLALPPTWHRLYAALDAPRKDAGTDGRAGVLRRGATEDDLRRFTHTADNYKAVGVEARHANPDFRPPPNPMTLNEGAEFVRRVVEAWIDQLLDEASLTSIDTRATATDKAPGG